MLICLPSSQDPQSFFYKHQFWLFLASAFIVHQIPLVSIPFKWLESYFHEISHGIAALVSGGSIVKIQLFANGAGLCTTQGGSRFLISFMGYAGATLWGALIYTLAKSHQRVALVSSAILLAMISLTILLWARDLLTVIILLMLIVLFALPFKLRKQQYLQSLLQFSGVIVLLNSFYSPFHLLSGRAMGDSHSLSDLTFIPSIVWVAIWVVFALFVTVLLAKKGKVFGRKKLNVSA